MVRAGGTAGFLVATAFVLLLALALLTVVLGVITALSVNRRTEDDSERERLPR
ncbi:hypothetical protein ACIF6L_00290 [Kitasatospora sp. NPDC086009]|uniref:hypothetical protein n=1 Tax=unclassified Kitasatospora TaxID=2633591 RepID=UPI0036E02561